VRIAVARYCEVHNIRGGEMILRWLAVVLTWIAATAAFAAKAPNPPEPKSIEELDKALAFKFAEAKIPGVSVTIVEAGQIVLSKAYGFSDVAAQKPVTPQTVFRAGSISKSFTGAAIMMLVEEGKLDLNAKLSDLMPELRYDNAWEATDPIRLIHLVEHTTGFDDIAFRHYLIEGKDIGLDKAVDLYGPYKSRWRPGERVSYCNSGPVIAGRIIEKATGKRYQDFIAERITGPLGMTTAFWTKVPQIEAQMSKSYKADGVTEEPFVEIPARPSGSLNVTSKDLIRFPMMLMNRGSLDGVALLKPDTVAKIERAESSAGARAGLTQGYGKGVLVYPGKRVVFHGHDGGIDGFVAKYEYAPSIGAAFVMMANAPKAELLNAADTVRAYLERDAPALASGNIPLVASELAKLEGNYQSIAPRQQVLAPLLGLTQWQGAKADNGALLFNDSRRIHVGANMFRKEDAVAPNIVFVDEPGGVRMYTATGANRMVPLWEMWAKVAAIGLFVASAALSLLHAAIWIPSAFMGRLGERGGVAIRLLPLLALILAAAVPAGFVALLTVGDSQMLGTASVPAQALYAVSIAAPVAAALALLRTLAGSEDASIVVRGLAWMASVCAVIACAYFAATGWLGLQIWM
jgi:CubicO group peptidase (beta-lactamase class C family)